MKTFSSAILGAMRQQYGCEPIVIVGIQWDAQGYIYYGTKAVKGVCSGNILNLGNISTSIKTGNTGTVSTCSVSLSDPKGLIKGKFDFSALEKAPAKVILWFEGMEDINDALILIDGVVSGSEPKWDEGNRIISFEVETNIESNEVGYAPTKEDIADLSEDAEGVPWPIVFGSVKRVPAVHARKHREGELLFDILIKSDIYDYNESKGLRAIDNVVVASYTEDGGSVQNRCFIYNGEKFPQDTEVKIIFKTGDGPDDGVVFSGKFGGTEFAISEANSAKYDNVTISTRASGEDFKNPYVLWINQINGAYPTLKNHHCYISGLNGYAGTAPYYNYCIAQDKSKLTFKFPFKRKNKLGESSTESDLLANQGKIVAYALPKTGTKVHIEQFIKKFADLELTGYFDSRGKTPFGGILHMLGMMKNAKNGLFNIPAGSIVRLWNQADPDIYIPAWNELSEIKQVYGKRKINKRTILAPIPKSYYTIQSAKYTANGQKTTGIIFNKPLSDYKNSEWEDEIYTDCTSTIGPKLADNILWLVKNFTNMNIEAGSFNFAQTKMGESNFALFDKRDALKLAEEMAWQGRAALISDSTNVSLKYLAYADPPKFYINEDNVEFKTLNVSYTDINDINTKLIALWNDNYRSVPKLSPDNQSDLQRFRKIVRALNTDNDAHRKVENRVNTYIYDQGIQLYGLKTREQEFFVYTDVAEVVKSLKFWGYRTSRPFKKVSFNCLDLSILLLQPFDTVNVAFTDGTLIRSNNIDGYLESVNYDFATQTVSATVWLPMESGTTLINTGEVWPG